jgi:DNA-binding NtrC family response regulator
MPASNGTSKKKHTVLIVDDEADIRKLVGATVQRQGYNRQRRARHEAV